MSHYCSTHRLPRARIDPIDSADVALALLCAVVSDPPAAETIAVLLDHEHRGLSILCVSGTRDPDAVFDVADHLIEIAADRERFGAVVIASVRPGYDHHGSDAHHDIERWMELSDQLDGAGIELLEWFILGRDESCPRDLLGEPPRWRP